MAAPASYSQAEDHANRHQSYEASESRCSTMSRLSVASDLGELPVDAPLSLILSSSILEHRVKRGERIVAQKLINLANKSLTTDALEELHERLWRECNIPCSDDVEEEKEERKENDEEEKYEEKRREEERETLDEKVGEVEEKLSAIEANINLRDNQLSSPGVSRLLDIFLLPSVTELDLSYNGIEREGLVSLSILLSRSTALKHIFLSGNEFSQAEEELSALGEGIRENSSLTSLSFNGCSLLSQGLIKLAPGLMANDRLTFLDLSSNQIKKEGIAALAACVSMTSNLRTLELGWNQLGDESIDSVLLLLQTLSCTLETLGLAENNLGSQGIITLSSALEESRNCRLNTLKLYKNNIGDDGLAALAHFLRSNTSLTSLDVENNAYGISGLNAMIEALSHSNQYVRQLSVGHGTQGMPAEYYRAYRTLHQLIDRNRILFREKQGLLDAGLQNSQPSTPVMNGGPKLLPAIFTPGASPYGARAISYEEVLQSTPSSQSKPVIAAAGGVSGGGKVGESSGKRAGGLSTEPAIDGSDFALVPTEQWTSPQVAAWLLWQGFPHSIALRFAEQQIDGSVLDQVDDELLLGEHFCIDNVLIRRSLVAACHVAATSEDWITDGAEGHERFWTVRQVQGWVRRRLSDSDLGQDFIEDICKKIQDNCVHGELFVHLDRQELQEILPVRRKSGPKLKAQKLLQEKAVYARYSRSLSFSYSGGQPILTATNVGESSQFFEDGVSLTDAISVHCPGQPCHRYSQPECICSGSEVVCERAERGSVIHATGGAGRLSQHRPSTLDSQHRASTLNSLDSPSSSSRITLRDRRSSSLVSRYSNDSYVVSQRGSITERRGAGRLIRTNVAESSQEEMRKRQRGVSGEGEGAGRYPGWREQLTTAAMVSVLTSLSLIVLLTLTNMLPLRNGARGV